MKNLPKNHHKQVKFNNLNVPAAWIQTKMKNYKLKLKKRYYKANKEHQLELKEF